MSQTNNEERSPVIEAMLEFASDVELDADKARATLEAEGVDVGAFLERLDQRVAEARKTARGEVSRG